MENRQTQALADAWHGQQQRIFARGDFLSLTLELFFELRDLMIEMFDHGQVVLERELAQRIIFGRQQLFLPGIADAASLFGRSAIVGQLMGVDAGQQLGAAPDIEEALAQKRPQRPLLGGIDIGGWNEVRTQQMGELLRIDAVVFIFASVYRFDVEGMRQNEGQARGLAGIGQPVPAKHAFAAHGQIVLVRLD